LLFGQIDFIDLTDCINIPTAATDSVLKCRVIYRREIEAIEFESYQIRSIQSLKLIVADDLDYHFKYFDREAINKLLKERGNCDDIIIVKDGLLTDASYANLLLHDGNEWITPARPLLKGTMRAHLLDSGKITEADIPVLTLKNYEKIKLINAMMPFELAPEVLIDKVF
jgi:4-amino-4-deoxychorismate lyase